MIITVALDDEDGGVVFTFSPPKNVVFHFKITILTSAWLFTDEEFEQMMNDDYFTYSDCNFGLRKEGGYAFFYLDTEGQRMELMVPFEDCIPVLKQWFGLLKNN